MKAKLASSFLALSLILVASLAHAQLSVSFGFSVPQNDPNFRSQSANTGGIGSGAATGQTDGHTAVIRWEADLTYTGSTPPSSVTINYGLVSYAQGEVKLDGLTPPTGTGRDTAEAGNCYGTIPSVTRGTTAIDAQNNAGPLSQAKTISASVGWTYIQSQNCYRAAVILETDSLKTGAHIDSVGTTGPSAPTGDGGGEGGEGGSAGGAPILLPGDLATGTLSQSISGSVTSNP